MFAKRLSAIVAVGVLTLAGCAGSEDGDEQASPTDEQTPVEGTPDATTSPEVEAEIATIEWPTDYDGGSTDMIFAGTDTHFALGSNEIDDPAGGYDVTVTTVEGEIINPSVTVGEPAMAPGDLLIRDASTGEVLAYRPVTHEALASSEGIDR